MKGGALALLTFTRVFLLAFQTLNVVGGQFWAAVGVSWGLAFCDVGFVVLSIRLGWWAVPWVGAGGSLGVVAAMWSHGRIF